MANAGEPPRSAAAEQSSGDSRHRPDFLSASSPYLILTPGTPSQHVAAPARGDPKPGGPPQSPDCKRSTELRHQTSSPTTLRYVPA